tara:strand:+ start:656 stop:961 length:306 start_codon:yes stop_codon:yes gene_type:complete
MTNILIDVVASAGSGIGASYGLRALGKDGKWWGYLSLVIGLVVFQMLPGMFDDVTNSQHMSKDGNDAIEALSDGWDSVWRTTLIVVIAITAAIMTALKKED